MLEDYYKMCKSEKNFQDFIIFKNSFKFLYNIYSLVSFFLEIDEIL